MGQDRGQGDEIDAQQRESDPVWRKRRPIPPSPSHAYQQAKVLSWVDSCADKKAACDNTGMDPSGHTFLMRACLDNQESLVAELLKRGSTVDLKAKGKTALHFACIMAQVNCATLLLHAGADVSIRVDEDDSDYTECDGMTPLEIVEYKLPGTRDPTAARLRELRQLLRARMGLPNDDRPPSPGKVFCGWSKANAGRR